MNIPLNIDWQQILLHFFNFAILAFGLYLLLYKPVKDLMEKRTAYYRQLETEAKEKLDSAAALETKCQTQLSQIDEEVRQKREAALKGAEAQAAAELQSAREQAEKILSDARAEAKAQKQQAEASSRREIAELAAAAAEILVKEALKA